MTETASAAIARPAVYVVLAPGHREMNTSAGQEGAPLWDFSEGAIKARVIELVVVEPARSGKAAENEVGCTSAIGEGGRTDGGGGGTSAPELGFGRGRRHVWRGGDLGGERRHSWWERRHGGGMGRGGVVE
uniref:Uncharacterized protein n=1 Tax=Oryza sativa subsp. japonica TaxID=39947 RepID=Q7XHK6_ORYSJ|nr:hypothetical protein [Oryza sativa Japonica Group]BAD30118.1 hypothetical protein [Oryza sativa Japonica Group]